MKTGRRWKANKPSNGQTSIALLILKYSNSDLKI